MASFIEKDQRVLFAVGPTGCSLILAAQGELAVCEARDYWCMEDILHSSKELRNLPPGLYIWEGEIWCETGGWCGSELVDSDIDWNGTWRPATFGDLFSFGLKEDGLQFPSLPPQEVPNEA